MKIVYGKPEDLTEAKRLRTKYNRILRNNSAKARQGDNEAAIDVITQMTEYETALRAIGYRETDETDGRPQLVPITKEWRQAQRAKRTKVDKLTIEARNGDETAMRELIRCLASGEE